MLPCFDSTIHFSFSGSLESSDENSRRAFWKMVLVSYLLDRSEGMMTKSNINAVGMTRSRESV